MHLVCVYTRYVMRKHTALVPEVFPGVQGVSPSLHFNNGVLSQNRRHTPRAKSFYVLLLL
jgi:hypothetical protein